MAELQTVAAVLDLLKVAYEVGIFLKKVKDADRLALEIGERIDRLESVLEGVRSVLKQRDANGVSTQGSDAIVAKRIDESIVSCSASLKDLQTRVGVFQPALERQSVSRPLLERLKIAFRHPSISRINTELEARIQTLSTDLAVLQLFDQTKTSSSVLQAIADLDVRVNDGHQILSQMLRQQSNDPLQNPQQASSNASVDGDSISEDAIERLSECLRNAEDVREQFTSEYAPDDRSYRFRRGLPEDSPFGIATPVMEPLAGRELFLYDAEIDGEVVWPLELLSINIEAYAEKASIELELGHFHQAEWNLNHAIKNSQIREAHYSVPFTARAQMQEQMALLYKQQKKHAEAVAIIHELLRERSPSMRGPEPEEQASLAQARQNQLLASIYFDRHISNIGPALSHTNEDIEMAEKHAMIAFNKRWDIFGGGDRPPDEAEQHKSSIQMLVRILELSDKPVEANELSKRLGDSASTMNESVRGGSFSTNADRQAEFEVVDKHDMLVEAIRSGESEQVQSLLAGRDLDLERLSKGKTVLMHAVERSDESTVHKLLDPEVGAYRDTLDQRGRTALHLAASQGLHDMVRCLLHHDADIDTRDCKHEPPVAKAVKAGDATTVQIFFNHDSETLQAKSGGEFSLLHIAVRTAHMDVTRLLIRLSPELKDAVDHAGKTALHHCAEADWCAHAAVLLECGADPNAVDSVSRTPLYLAASKPPTAVRENMVRLLISHGAKVDERRPPPRMRDYPELKRNGPRRDSALSRTSVSTSGSLGTVSTSASRLSRLFSRSPRNDG